MQFNKRADISLKILTALLLLSALLLTLTTSDYYIFNKFGTFNAAFIISQWLKKSGVVLLPLAVFIKSRSCGGAAKYILPVAVIVSACTYGGFFDVSKLNDGVTGADAVYAHVNEFISKPLNMALFFTFCALCIAICAMLFWRDGARVNFKSFFVFLLATVAVTPLNIFENFFTLSQIPPASVLWFKNFSVWHFLSLILLVAATVGTYFLLRRKTPDFQHKFLCALALVLLVQYHSKDSVIMGDGYNVYHTVFACLPLYICNIGVYVSSIAVFAKKRFLYAIAFFVHAVGALSVFVYFGKDEMSEYGIIFSYTFLYFCTTHGLLFILSVMPAALEHYVFKIKDCIIPLIYFSVVLIIAAVASCLVTSASMSFSYNGYTLQESEWIYPNYSFTIESPIPITFPTVPIRVWKCDLNVLYIIILYAFYCAMFWAFVGVYHGVKALTIKFSNRKTRREKSN